MADNESPPGTPCWVKVFGSIGLVLVLLVGGLILLGGGSGGGHGPGRHIPGNDTVATDNQDEATDAEANSGSEESGDPTPHSDMSESSPAEGQLPVSGVLVAQDGYELQLLSGQATAGEPTELEFRIIGPDGEVVTDFTPTHDEQMHLILVRWDLTGFQHVHPTMDADGTWRIPITFEEAGDYRAYADFAPAGRSEAMTLATNVAVSGSYTPSPLPEPSAEATVDDYTVELDGELVAGETGQFTLTVSKDGAPVTDLGPYLAAYGHLVVLRDGDLAYLHVHTEGEPDDGTTEAGPEITFHVEVPTAGNYRLFLDFKHDGTVRTADFTVEARPSATGNGEHHTPPVDHDDENGDDHGGGH